MKWLIVALQPVALQVAGVIVQLLAARLTDALQREADRPPAVEPRLPLGR